MPLCAGSSCGGGASAQTRPWISAGPWAHYTSCSSSPRAVSRGRPRHLHTGSLPTDTSPEGAGAEPACRDLSEEQMELVTLPSCVCPPPTAAPPWGAQPPSHPNASSAAWPPQPMATWQRLEAHVPGAGSAWLPAAWHTFTCPWAGLPGGGTHAKSAVGGGGRPCRALSPHQASCWLQGPASPRRPEKVCTQSRDHEPEKLVGALRY